ncbi:anoctamin-1-like [Anopheles ziemanni]|uniref:anoctamin-1-like n=1 Tax=Anopheles coustani TaxID=139045 RepID=UPI0026593DD5|nr:anoctamin-1-like [Anopheles coustani]XP_058178639.1 anoctamin-1-like [Anopheles ziemanni]
MAHVNVSQCHRITVEGYFDDQTTIVDFVLAYKPQKNSINNERRGKFIDKLTKAGLITERDTSQNDTHYVKINVPDKILKKYCEFMKMKMPMRKLDGQDKIKPKVSYRGTLESMIPNCITKRFNHTKPAHVEYRLLHEYSEPKSYLFEEKRGNFFSTGIRIAVVNFILERSSFKEKPSLDSNLFIPWASEQHSAGADNAEEVKYFGIRQLLEAVDGEGEHPFYAAYPLHDGCVKHKDTTRSIRARLLVDWASVKQCLMYQPLDDIKEYFGVKIALYFTWLGFYTTMLLPAALVGFFCLLYGILTFSTNRISQEVCSDNTTIMCPQCDKYCGYWHLNSTCKISKIAYIFDNEATIFFSIFISVWAALYLKLWKRYVSRIQYRWGVLDYCSMAEPPRPEYSARVKDYKRRKYNFYTKVEEPSPAFWTQKLPTVIGSYFVVYLLISMTVATVFGIIVYRMSLKTSENLYGDSASVSGKLIIFPMTTATINLLASTVLTQLYNKVAKKMTDYEYRRTQSEYNDSLNVKLFLFDFINYYSSIFYIAFLKGKLPGYPKEYNRIFSLRQEECSTGGCMVELTIQLATIMMGKQLIAIIKEYFIPFLKQKYKNLSTWYYTNQKEMELPQSSGQWIRDNKLLSWGELSLFKEYLKMVIQYGFITIFAVAFPPASIFALVNNMIETRVDAKKYLQFYKRAVPTRVRNLGMWYNTMQVITKIAVISNAYIIAFSSNITHRLIYMLFVNPAYTDEGFVNHTLAYFNTSHFEAAANPDPSLYKNITVEICRYAEYRNPPESDNPYERSLLYWKILAIRLALMVIYQNLVVVVQALVSWAIPNIPRQLQLQIKKEQYFTNEYIIKQEKKRTTAITYVHMES